jgi:hypothetical protein
MPRFRVTHNSSGETWEVDTEFSDDARQVVGWKLVDCRVFLLRDGPFSEIVPPKVAVQVAPPKPGTVPICPDCNATMLEKDGQEFWWTCSSCDLVYHEWDNQFFQAGDLP